MSFLGWTFHLSSFCNCFYLNFLYDVLYILDKGLNKQVLSTSTQPKDF